VDHGRVPDAAAGVDLGVAPEVALHGVERPSDVAGGGVEGADHAPVAGGVDAADADGHGAGEDGAVGDDRLDVDAGRVGGGDVGRPRLGAVRGVEGDHAGRRVHAVHVPVAHGDPEGADVEAAGLGRPPLVTRGPVEGVDPAEPALEVDGVALDDRDGGQGAGTLEPGPPALVELVDVLAGDARARRRPGVEQVLTGGGPVGGVLDQLVGRP